MLAAFTPLDVCKKVGAKTTYTIFEGYPMYCCYEFQRYAVNDPRVPISYESRFRYYYVMAEKRTPMTIVLPRCPICNRKFPKTLVRAYYKVLKKECGIDQFSEESKKDLVPEEFLTDEWWIKRGL